MFYRIESFEKILYQKNKEIYHNCTHKDFNICDKYKYI